MSCVGAKARVREIGKEGREIQGRKRELKKTERKVKGRVEKGKNIKVRYIDR